MSQELPPSPSVQPTPQDEVPKLPVLPQRKMLRPSARELEKTTLKETPNGQLLKTSQPLPPSLHVRSNTLQDLLSNRVPKRRLEETNVLPQGQGAISVQKQAQSLLKQKRRDSLQAQLNNRPSLEALAERNVYQILKDDNNNTSHIPLALEYHHAEVSQEFITVPHRIEGLRDIIQVACGWSHSLALSKDGQVFSWGSNLNGRLGRTVPKTPKPIDIQNDSTDPESATDKASPESADNQNNNNNNNNNIPSRRRPPMDKGGGDEFVKPADPSDFEQDSTPRLVVGLPKCHKIACGDHHNAAICDDGLWVWGRNEFGMLGLGHRDDVTVPTRVDVTPIIRSLGLPEDAKINDIALGANHTVLIIHGKALAAGWNKGNRLGLVSQRHFVQWPFNDDHDPTVICRFQPIKGLSAPLRAQSSLSIRNVAAGDVMTIAIANTPTTQVNHNNVFLWGTSMHSSPYPIIELNGVEIRMVKMGANFCTLLTNSGEICCFGSNRDYQLGRPASSDITSFHAPAPIKIDPQYYYNQHPPQFLFVACGKYSALAIDRTGRLFGWGLSKHGMCGSGLSQSMQPPTPVDVTTILDEKSQPLFATQQEAIDKQFGFLNCDGGASHSLVVDRDGFVYAMGSFRNGKLGL